MSDKLKEVASAKETSVTKVAENQSIVNFNAETLIAQAIQQNVPVEALERLLAMRTQLKAEWAKEQFDRAMAKFQSECPVIEKKKKVSFNTTNYSYAPLDEIVEQVKTPLASNGFSFTFDTEQNDKSMKVFCKAKHISGHTETSVFQIVVDESSKMNKSQQYGSTLTYAKRYCFCNAFGILTGDEDNDAQNVSIAAEAKLPPKSAKSDFPPSKAQLLLIGKVMKEKGITKDDIIDAGFVGDSRELTGGQNGTASELIGWLFEQRSKIINGYELPVIQQDTTPYNPRTGQEVFIPSELTNLTERQKQELEEIGKEIK